MCMGPLVSATPHGEPKMANNWLELGTTQNPNGSKSRTSATAKTPYDKMLINFDEQLAMFNSGRKPDSKMGQAKQWFKDAGQGITEITIRYAGKPLPIFPEGATSFFVEKKNVKAVAKGIKADLDARAFDDVIKPLDDALNASVAQRSASRAANKK